MQGAQNGVVKSQIFVCGIARHGRKVHICLIWPVHRQIMMHAKSRVGQIRIQDRAHSGTVEWGATWRPR